MSSGVSFFDKSNGYGKIVSYGKLSAPTENSGVWVDDGRIFLHESGGEGNNHCITRDGCFTTVVEGIYTFSIDCTSLDIEAMGLASGKGVNTALFLVRVGSLSELDRTKILETHLNYGVAIKPFINVIELKKFEMVMLMGVLLVGETGEKCKPIVLKNGGDYQVFYNEIPK